MRYIIAGLLTHTGGENETGGNDKLAVTIGSYNEPAVIATTTGS
jgi:hypothetical protein